VRAIEEGFLPVGNGAIIGRDKLRSILHRTIDRRKYLSETIRCWFK
jgi:hypothetical protein